MIEVGFKRLTDDAILPVKAHPTDSGFDLYTNESAVIEPGGTKVIKTGIAIQLPAGYEAQVRPRSGLTSKTDLRVQLGTIDNGYTGEIGIITDNRNIFSSDMVRKGKKLAQLVIQQLPQVDDYEIDSLQETSRGTNGFGSSGY